MIDWFMDLDLIWQIIVGIVVMSAASTVVGFIFKTASSIISVAVVVALVYFGFLFFSGETGFGMMNLVGF